ncbi:MAG TPA: peptidylprolyl isomerase [Patescibacteria group bacterium]|nr:peptidylprolyl isomerase [Patescibacteria group bacterium]
MRKEVSSFFKVKNKRKKIILAIILIIAFIVINGLCIYFRKSAGHYLSVIEKIIPYPAFFVGKEYITLDEYNSKIDLNKKLYELSYKMDFGNSEEGKKNLQDLRKKTKEEIIETIIMENVLSSSGKYISKKDIKDEFDKGIKDIGSDKEIKNILKYSANLKESDVQWKIQYNLLKDSIRDNVLYSLKLKIIAVKTLDINNSQDWEVSKLKAEKIIEESNSNANFFNNYFVLDNDKNDIIVQNFGREYYTIEDLPKEFRNAFLSLMPGQISAPLKTDLGYYILKDEGQKGSFRGSFSDFIQDQKNKTKVVSFIY